VGRRPAALGLALVAVLAGLVAVLAASAPPPSAARPAALAPLAPPGPPCLDPSGLCPAPDVCPPGDVSRGPAELARIRPDVEALLDRAYFGVGDGVHTVDVFLFQGHEPLAAELQRRFGGAVAVELGTTRWCGGPGHSARCADLAGGRAALPDGLRLALTLDDSSVAATTPEVKGALHVRYDGPGNFTLDHSGQPVLGKVVRPGTGSVVGTNVAPLAGTGLSVEVAAAHEMTIPVVVGLARCDGGLGSALPPGTYGVRAGLGPDGGPPLYYAPEVELTIR
jgi:hypothetical protein